MKTTTGTASKALLPLPAILGLDQAPPGPDRCNRFFFRSPLIDQRLALLKNMVGGSSLLIVLVGERGSGKTTLMHQFIAGAGDKWQIGRIKLKRRGKSSRELWHNLNDRMVFFSRRSGPPSVMIDDAHQLSPTELKLLLQHAVTDQGQRRIQNIVLLAEPQMRERFAELAGWLPAKSVIDKIFMTPFTEKQTAAYLEHRVRAAGVLRNNPFTASHVREIYKQSGGLPGWINGEAFLLLKKISRHQQGFKQSSLMGLWRLTMRVQWLLKERSRTLSSQLRNMAHTACRHGKRRQQCFRC